MQSKRLVGAELLTFVRKNAGADRDLLAIEAGYYQMRHGIKSVERSEFLQAIAHAHGTPVGRCIPNPGNRGRQLLYKIKVSPKGIAPIGPGYLKQIGVDAGGFVRVCIEDDVIVLEPDNQKESEANDAVPFDAS